MESEQRIVLIGRDISHSLSPEIHRSLFAEQKLPWSYNLLDIEPEALADAVAMLRDPIFRGANVTSPYKETVIEYLDKLHPVALRIGSVNTVRNDAGKLTGFNTDVAGFGDSLVGNRLFNNSFTAAVLGSGGAARAAVEALLAFKTLVSLTLYSRIEERAKSAIARWNDPRLKASDIALFRAADLVVHATPFGMNSPCVSLVDAVALRGTHILYDMIYSPPITGIMQQAVLAGAETIGGEAMLQLQAIEAFRVWRGSQRPEG